MAEDGTTPALAAVVDPGTSPQFATIEQLNEMSEKIAGDFKAGIGRLPSMISEQLAVLKPITPTPIPGKEEKAVDPQAEVAALLKAERAELAAEKSAVTRERIRSEIEAELVGVGVRPESIKLAADSLMMRNEGKLEVERSGLGESRGIYKDSEFAEAQAIPAFIKAFSESTEGRSILQPVKVPSLNNVPGGRGPISGEVVRMTRAEASKADPKLLKSGRVELID